MKATEKWRLHELANGFSFREKKGGSEFQVRVCVSVPLSGKFSVLLMEHLLLLKFERPLGFRHGLKNGRILFQKFVVNCPE